MDVLYMGSSNNSLIVDVSSVAEELLGILFNSNHNLLKNLYKNKKNINKENHNKYLKNQEYQRNVESDYYQNFDQSVMQYFLL